MNGTVSAFRIDHWKHSNISHRSHTDEIGVFGTFSWGWQYLLLHTFQLFFLCSLSSFKACTSFLSSFRASAALLRVGTSQVLSVFTHACLVDMTRSASFEDTLCVNRDTPRVSHAASRSHLVTDKVLLTSITSVTHTLANKHTYTHTHVYVFVRNER